MSTSDPNISATVATDTNNMIACNVCGNMVPERNMSIHRAHACRGVARSSTREDNEAVAAAASKKDEDDDVIDLCDDDSPNRKRPSSPPTSPAPPRRRGRPKRDDDDAMEIDDDSDDEVEIVDNPVVDLSSEEWACSRCTLLNDHSKSVCEACGGRKAPAVDSDGVRAADPVRRERLIDDDFLFASGNANNNSPLATVGGGALLGSLIGGAGAYMRGRSISSGALEGGVAGALGGAFAHEMLSPGSSGHHRPRRSSAHYEQTSHPLSQARSASTMGQPSYPVLSHGTRRSTRQPRSSVRVVSTPSADGTTTTIVSTSGRDGSTRIVRRSAHSHSGHDPLMSLMLHSVLQDGGNSRRNSTDAIDRASYEQLLAAFGDGTENLGASGGAIAALPTSKVKTRPDGTVDLPPDACECSICLEPFETNQIRKTLPCLHGFHNFCVDKWLRTNGACPVCKFRVDN